MKNRNRPNKMKAVSKAMARIQPAWVPDRTTMTSPHSAATSSSVMTIEGRWRRLYGSPIAAATAACAITSRVTSLTSSCDGPAPGPRR